MCEMPEEPSVWCDAGREGEAVKVATGASGVHGAVCLQRALTQQVFPSINLLHTAA